MKLPAPRSAVDEPAGRIAPIVEEEIGLPPDVLPDEARAVWEECVRDWPLLARGHRQVLALYCRLRASEDVLEGEMTRAVNGADWDAVAILGTRVEKIRAQLARLLVDLEGIGRG